MNGRFGSGAAERDRQQSANSGPFQIREQQTDETCIRYFVLSMDRRRLSPGRLHAYNICLEATIALKMSWGLPAKNSR
jgi:hypothetical protein